LTAEPDSPAPNALSGKSLQTATEPGRPIGLWAPALLMALVVAGLWLPNLMRPPPPAFTTYKNVKGQIRRVLLTDKSVIRLNGASVVKVVYQDADRRVDMGEAEAAFSMTSDRSRPFVIMSGDRRIRITGGEINVLRETTRQGGKTTLTVREGQARLYTTGQLAEGVNVGPDQEASWTDGQADPQIRRVYAPNAFAWESHQLAYAKEPLSDVVADLNRYVARPIVIGDPTLASLPYSGMLTLEGEEAMLRKIAQALPIVAVSQPAEIVLRRAVPKPPPKPKVKKPASPLMQSLMTLNRPHPKPLPKPAPPGPLKTN
jgi:transmembrane sensor